MEAAFLNCTRVLDEAIWNINERLEVLRSSVEDYNRALAAERWKQRDQESNFNQNNPTLSEDLDQVDEAESLVANDGEEEKARIQTAGEETQLGLGKELDEILKRARTIRRNDAASAMQKSSHDDDGGSRRISVPSIQQKQATPSRGKQFAHDARQMATGKGSKIKHHDASKKGPHRGGGHRRAEGAPPPGGGAAAAAAKGAATRAAAKSPLHGSRRGRRPRGPSPSPLPGAGRLGGEELEQMRARFSNAKSEHSKLKNGEMDAQAAFSLQEENRQMFLLQLRKRQEITVDPKYLDIHCPPHTSLAWHCPRPKAADPGIESNLDVLLGYVEKRQEQLEQLLLSIRRQCQPSGVNDINTEAFRSWLSINHVAHLLNQVQDDISDIQQRINLGLQRTNNKKLFLGLLNDGCRQMTDYATQLLPPTAGDQTYYREFKDCFAYPVVWNSNAHRQDGKESFYTKQKSMVSSQCRALRCCVLADVERTAGQHLFAILEQKLDNIFLTSSSSDDNKWQDYQVKNDKMCLLNSNSNSGDADSKQQQDPTSPNSNMEPPPADHLDLLVLLKTTDAILSREGKPGMGFFFCKKYNNDNN